MSINRYVRPGDDGWDIVIEGHVRAIDQGETKQQAINLATELTAADGGGEIRVLNREGKLTARTAVPPGGVRRKAAA